jgi:hypothetical protein
MTMFEPDRRPWNVHYYREILEGFRAEGYRTMTFSTFHAAAPKDRQRILLLRKDVDDRPDRIPDMWQVDKSLGFCSTYFFHVHATYNCFFYDVYNTIRQLLASGNEVGLHSNFVEFAQYFGEDPFETIRRERAMLEAIVGGTINGHACHRDLNYIYNSLPFLNAHGAQRLGFKWSAYDPLFHTDNILYVNEGFGPHLIWRNQTPEQAAKTGKNVCLLLHPNWWHRQFHTGQ